MGWGPRTDEGSQGTVVINPVPVIVEFQDISAVPNGAQENILDFTTSSGASNLFLNRVEFGGSNVALYTLLIGGTQIATFYSHFCNLNGSWDFPTLGGGLPLPASTRIQVTVTHTRPFPGDFYARLNMVNPA